MRWNELWKGIGYELLSAFLPLEILDVSTDSRCVDEGCIFVCINGNQHDGADFLGDVLKRRCKCIVIDRRECVERLLARDEHVLEHVCVVLVDDCRETYALLCRNLFHRPDEGLKLIGITGTKGKTTTASYINQLLKADGVNTGVIGTCGAQWCGHTEKLDNTTPDAHGLFSLLKCMRDEGVTHVVMEVSSQGLKQKRVNGITYSVGVFTNLYPDHISATEHGDMEEYFYWKRQLFCQSRTAVIPEQTISEYAGRLYDELQGRMPVFNVTDSAVFYDENGECLFKIKGSPEYIKHAGRLAQHICVENRAGEELHCDLTPGSFQVSNYLFALAVVNALGLSLQEIVLETVPGRMECVCEYEDAYFYVDYAHNAEALREALISLRAFKPHRLICVFGCGGGRSALRRGPMGHVSTEIADLTIITEDNSRNESFLSICEDIVSGINANHKDYIVIEDRDRAIKYAVSTSEPGDIVLIAGKGHEDYMEKNGKRTHFLDAEEIIKYVSLRKHNH